MSHRGLKRANKNHLQFNYKIMSEATNEERLLRNVTFTGFGESLNDAIKEKIANGLPAFQLIYKENVGRNEATAILKFRQDKEGDYHFNSYDLSLKAGNSDRTLKRTYYIGKVVTIKVDGADGEPTEKKLNNTYKLSEGINLLSGGAVKKEFYKLNKVEKDGKEVSVPGDTFYSAWV